MIIAAVNGVPENKLVNLHSEKKRHNGFSVPYDIAGTKHSSRVILRFKILLPINLHQK